MIAQKARILLAVCAAVIGLEDIFAQAVPAPVGRVEYYYGTTCGPSSPQGSPRIDVLEPPVLGANMTVLLQEINRWKYWQGCLVGGLAWLAVGSSRSSLGGMPLPFLLPSALTIGYPCWVATSTDICFAGLSQGLLNVGSSYGEIAQLSVPNVPSLLDMRVYCQWLVNVRAGGGTCPFIYDHWFTSNAAAVVIGR